MKGAVALPQFFEHKFSFFYFSSKILSGYARFLSAPKAPLKSEGSDEKTYSITPPLKWVTNSGLRLCHIDSRSEAFVFKNVLPCSNCFASIWLCLAKAICLPPICVAEYSCFEQ